LFFFAFYVFFCGHLPLQLNGRERTQRKEKKKKKKKKKIIEPSLPLYAFFVAVSLCQLKMAAKRTQRKEKKNHRAILASLCVLCGHFPCNLKWPRKNTKKSKEKS